MKKIYVILLGLFLFAIWGKSSFAQDEAKVMRRYDFSSPKASFESLKKAIKDKDLEGVLIHNWNIGKILSSNKNIFENFEEFYNKMKTQYPNDSIIESIEEWYSSNGEWVKLTETEFLKQEEIYSGEHDTTYTHVIAQRTRDGKQIKLVVVNKNGTKEWWIFIYPGGE